MDVLLIGTGDAVGLPVAGCGCVACRAAASGGRRSAGALLDGALTLDGPPGDDAGKAPGEVPAARVSTRPGDPDQLPPGDRLELVTAAGTFRVTAHAASTPLAGADDSATTGTLLVVTGPDGGPLIWAPATGPLPERTVAALSRLGAGQAVVGGCPQAGAWLPARSAVTSAGYAVARWRATGALAGSAGVALVGLGHAGPPAAEVGLRAARWGLQLPSDGDRLTDRPADRAGPPPHRTLVLGGAGSGKSALAEDLLAATPQVGYLATGAPDDGTDQDWDRRVAAHQARRPAWWSTQESTDVAAALAAARSPLLLDSVGTWLAAALQAAGAWSDDPGWRDRYLVERDRFLTAWRQVPVPVVAVSDEVGLGLVPTTWSGRLFADELGAVNQLLAAQSEQVLACVAGRTVVLADSTRARSGTGAR